MAAQVLSFAPWLTRFCYSHDIWLAFVRQTISRRPFSKSITLCRALPCTSCYCLWTWTMAGRGMVTNWREFIFFCEMITAVKISQLLLCETFSSWQLHLVRNLSWQRLRKTRASAVEPLNSRHIGSRGLVLYWKVVLFRRLTSKPHLSIPKLFLLRVWLGEVESVIFMEARSELTKDGAKSTKMNNGLLDAAW